MGRPSTWAALACLPLLLWPGCQGDVRPGETTLARIQRTGTVRIAYANEAPFGYRDPNTGRVTGEAPEIARVVLAGLGAQNIETSLVDFGQLIPGLEANRFDLTAAGMYITPARCEQIAFSNPTYCVGEAFLVRAGNPRDLHSYRDLFGDPTLRLGVVSGTVELTIAETLGIPEPQVVIFPDNVTALAGLRTGRIDAFGGTALTVDDVIERIQSGLEKAQPFEQPKLGAYGRNCGAFGVRKRDVAFRQALNEKLTHLIGTPAHLELVSGFGFGEQHLPGKIDADDLCRASAALD